MPENPKSPPEPSMEEIIASISRIITEDKAPGEPVRPIDENKSEVLELTEAVAEDGSVRRIPPFSENSSTTSSGPAGLPDPGTANAATHSEPGMSQKDAGAQPPHDLGRERILSSATSGAAAAAFAQLGALPRERRRDGELPLGGADRTLEDIVRDMLRPLLQAWLDEHLPGLVERLVREEIARVVGEAGFR
jgi:cell pole-organizing protein PopZ